MNSVKTWVREAVLLASISVFALSLAACGGGSGGGSAVSGSSGSSTDPGAGVGAGAGSGSSSSSSGSSSSSSSSSASSGGSQSADAQGTIVLPNGASGVAVVHIEDANGSLMSTPNVTNVAAAGPVTLVAEPPDFSQGLVAGGQTVQTFNNATTSPQIADNVQVPSAGTPISLSVIADTTFSVVQMSQLTGFISTCFTGGLHLTETAPGSGQTDLGPSGQPTDIAFAVSPDGTGMVGANTGGWLDVYTLSPMTTAHGENISGPVQIEGVTPSVTGRGAIAWNATSDRVLAGGPDGTLTVIANPQSLPPGSLPVNSQTNAIDLPGSPAVSSIAFAPNGQYAIVATASGLFIVTLDSQDYTPHVIAGPLDPSYVLPSGATYKLDQAQSIAITADGKYLVALTDEPTQSNGTLVAMPIDASGNVGAVGMIQSGLLATQGVDDIFAH